MCSSPWDISRVGGGSSSEEMAREVGSGSLEEEILLGDR